MCMKRKNRDKIISIILLILWCSLIFYFSNQNGEISSNESNFVIDILNSFLKLFNSNFNLLEIPNIVLIIRKLAHFFLYFVLYILAFNFGKKNSLKKIFIFALTFCIIYAISDEVHQLFIDARAFKLTDILIDSLGACVAALIFHK